MPYSLRLMFCCLCLLAYGLWPMPSGLWPMPYGRWSMAYALWPMAYTLWPMAYAYALPMTFTYYDL